MSSRMIRFTLNGRNATAIVEPYHNLVDLMQRFDLYGARESCGQGLCGCCTVMLDGEPVSGCLSLAVLADGRDICTVESLDCNGQLSAVQQAFIDAGAFQCGYCTPGFILMIEQLLARNPAPTDEQIRDWLAGNLCRCGTYPEIINAVHLAAAARREKTAA